MIDIPTAVWVNTVPVLAQPVRAATTGDLIDGGLDQEPEGEVEVDEEAVASQVFRPTQAYVIGVHEYLS